MEEYRHPIRGVEPYEEARRDDTSVASPDVLAAFYKDMERKEIVERKLSKKSNAGTSIWSRKSVKRSATAHSAPPPAHNSHQLKQEDNQRDGQRQEEEEQVTVNHDDSDKPDWVRPMNSPRSIVPDSKDLPGSYSKEAWDAVPVSSHKSRYFIHNPIGPRWYKNHHLIPRSETMPAARPPSFFSPSFPAIASSASQDRLDDSARLAGPSRTPSNSPLPTPNSSQTRVEDKPRARKTSETAHDVVDLWDVTDPWGTNWHHPSPYDIGLVNGPISADVQDVLQTRSRRSSVGQSQGRTVAPSPLSQSTSAVNLQVKPDIIQIPRKLSKRRTPTVATVFGGPPPDAGRHAASLPTTPMETQPPNSDLPKRMSVAAPPNGFSMSTHSISPKKEKRGSMLGRLVKKFSLLTKPSSDPSRDDDWQHINSHKPPVELDPHHSFVPTRQPSPEKPPSEAPRRVQPPPRVPPPPLEELVKADDAPKDVDSRSVASIEVPFSMGRLTIANPDTPGSGETTPAQAAVPLPPNKESLEMRSLHETRLQSISPPTPQPDLNPPMPPEKSPPRPIPQTKLPKDVAPEAPSASPITIRQSIVEQHRPVVPPQISQSLEHPPSVISHSSQASFGDSEAPALSTEMSTASSSRPPTSSSRKAPQPVDRPPSRHSQTLQPPPTSSHKARVASIASTVPFPAGDAGEKLQSYYEYDHSPLSAASMLANPPTPYTDTDMTMLATPIQPPPPLPLKIATDLPARQTETFKLIRSPSGNIYNSNQTIVAGGQQWELVGSEKTKGKGSSSSKEQTPKEPEPRTREPRDRHRDQGIKDRDSKDPDFKDRDDKDRDHRRGTKARDSRDYIRDSRDNDRVRDSRDREYDLRDREHARASRDRDYARDSRDRDYAMESKYSSRDRDRARESRDRDYPRDRDYHRESKDVYHARESRDRDHPRESKDRERDSKAYDSKARDSKDRGHTDRESSSRLQKKRHSKPHVEPEPEKDSRRRHRSHRESTSGAVERATTVSKAMSRAFEADARQLEATVAPVQPVQAVQADSKRPREDRERKLTRKRHETSPTIAGPSKPQPAPPPHAQDAPASRPIARDPSLSARPTSQLPSADEMNAMRAKEAWDMERLWKARSMQGDEMNRYTTMPTIPSNNNTPLMESISPPDPSSLYGSSHTAFVVQTPFHTQHSIYHSMPTAPPPIIYSSPSIPTVAHQVPPPKQRPQRTRIYAESVASDQRSYISARTHNPLPEVPREATYEIPSDARSSDYWTKYAGLATSY
ncbi:hypothetical protein DXG01_011894 [Tephrocybe rancida]|nr:hypothetical protein DXG01_011894 [Tephrocybe rancida]